jgi:hypothetical protein
MVDLFLSYDRIDNNNKKTDSYNPYNMAREFLPRTYNS